MAIDRASVNSLRVACNVWLEKHAGEARVHAISTRLFDEVAFMNNEQI